MAEINPASFYDENEIERLSGRIDATGGIDATGVATPDVGSAENAENITIKAGDSAQPGSGTGGGITIQPGDGDTPGFVRIKDDNGVIQFSAIQGTVELAHDDPAILRIGATGGTIGFYGVAPVAQPAVTGALSAVVDPAALAVLTSIIAGLVAVGLATDGTT